MIGTVFEDEQELLKAILEIHCVEGIDLDPMYSKGNFYRKIQEPKLKFDIEPQNLFTKKADAKDLPLKPNSINTMILDPPFCFGIHGKVKQNISAKRFTVLEDFNELQKLYKGILEESFRILKKSGVLIFKCQDYTDSKTTMTHCFVYKWATDIGFYAKDIAIFVRNQRIYNPKLVQRHLRKTHCYFWVFKK